MATQTFTAELGTDGSNATTATFPSSLVTINGATAYLRHDSTVALTGRLGYHYGVDSGSACYVQVALTSSKTQSFRGNFRLISGPSTPRAILRIRTGANAAIISLWITQSNTLTVRNAANSVALTTPVLAPGADYGISLTFTVGTGSGDGATTLKLYQKNGNAQIGTTLSTTTTDLGSTAAALANIGTDGTEAAAFEYVWDFIRVANDVGEFAAPTAAELISAGERWTTTKIGRLSLRETFELTANIAAGTDRRTLGLVGQESYPPLTSLTALRVRQEDILGLQNRLVPIVFQNFDDHSGWYQISDVNTSAINYQGEVASFSWSLQAERIGPENAVDLESRLTGVARINAHGLSGERWHAPPAGSYAYYTGTTQPSGSVARNASDGMAISAWRSVPASTNPRWAVALGNYGNGRARVKVDGTERVATNITVGASGWELNNGLISASMAGVSASATLNVANWDGTVWDSTAWNINVGASSGIGFTSFDAATVLRNDYEVCTVRLVKDRNPGRTLLDLTLRRGSRFVEGYLQNDASNLLAVYLKTAQTSTATASTGFVVATSNDANGNKVLVGSAGSFAGLTAQGGLSKASSTKLDFYVGAVVGGSAAASGDAATVLNSHYLTSMSEVTLGAVR